MNEVGKFKPHFVLCIGMFLIVNSLSFAENYSLDFDGVNDYATIMDGTSFSEYTISTWIKLNSVSAQNIILITTSGGPFAAVSHQIRVNSSGKFQHYLFDGSMRNVTGTTSVEIDTWYHIGVTATNNGKMRLYVNGQEEGTAQDIGTLWQDGDRWYIASNAAEDMGYCDGLMDELRIWDYALSQEQIIVEINTSLTGQETGLVGNWKFNEGEGLIAYNSVLGDPNAILENGTTWTVSNLTSSSQPDLLIRTDNEYSYTGNDIYDNGSSQTKNYTLTTNMQAIYDIILEADNYDILSSLILTGDPNTSGWEVEYYNKMTGDDITPEIISGKEYNLVNGARVELQVFITPPLNPGEGEVFNCALSVLSYNDPNASDTVIMNNIFSYMIPEPPYSNTYTIDADFAEGEMNGVEAFNDQLQIGDGYSALPFIWVPNSNEGTISKVDTVTGKELGRYHVGPSNSDPSRTTVDLYGNCWVGNRYAGTVVKVGLYENGQYYDRNNNGIIETSKDLNGNGKIEGSEILPWGFDECVLYEVVVIPGKEATYSPLQFNDYANDSSDPGPRGIAIDRYNNVWVGCYGTGIYYYIDGSNGQILKTIDISSENHTPYGAVVDENGILWSAGVNSNNLIWINPVDDTFGKLTLPQWCYGLGLDGNGHLFVSGGDVSKFSRVDVNNKVVEWTKDGYLRSRGVACTSDGDVWVANSIPNSVTRWTNDGIPIIEIPVGDTPTGVSVDNEGKVWVVDFGDEYIHRIDPNSNQIDLSVSIANTLHYGYSDMTGTVSRGATTKIGNWTVIHNSSMHNVEWGAVVWNSDEPWGTDIKVRVRSSNDRQKWSYWEDVVNYKPLHFTPAGKYLEVKATFQSTIEDVSPILYDLSVKPSQACGDINHPYPESDINNDCLVDLNDLVVLSREWLNCNLVICP